MIFFTDITTNASDYCLCNIKSFYPKWKTRRKKKLVMVDPGVHELVNRTEYSMIRQLHRLVEIIPAKYPNTHISIDYPSDMNHQHAQLFIDKSVKNNIKYANEKHYICTIQFWHRNFSSFKDEAEKLKPIWLSCPKIVGLGNLCRIMYPDQHTDDVFDWIINNLGFANWVHVYGMSFRCIVKYVPLMEEVGIKVSVDSTKWTRHVSRSHRTHEKIHCTRDTRDEFFLDYMDALLDRGVKVEWKGLNEKEVL
jgi:hypothetical protein